MRLSFSIGGIADVRQSLKELNIKSSLILLGMDEKLFTKEEIEKLRERRVPCFGTFIHPFRIVNNAKTSEWDTSIEPVSYTHLTLPTILLV